MNWHSIIFILLGLVAPFTVLGKESLATDRFQFSMEDNKSWELIDSTANITWHGEWVTDGLMKVTGTDDSCFIIGENEKGMVQLNCHDLKEISILISY